MREKEKAERERKKGGGKNGHRRTADVIDRVSHDLPFTRVVRDL